jgi:hypothetical protein
MPTVIPERVAASIDGDFVVFRIGIRINAFWKLHKWVPVFLAMPRMLRELDADPDSGLLGYETNVGLRNHSLVQYWRSFEQLRTYARDPEAEHLPAWKRFNRAVGSDGDVGIWHETFLVRDGEYETVYNNMPPFGLGAASDIVPASGSHETAAGRLGRTDGDDAAVTTDGAVDTGDEDA